MLILLSNDDGYISAGIESLYTSLSKIARVIMVAPDRERSAVSHKITLTSPIRITQIGKDRYITDASPADCVKVAFLKLVEEKIDLVVSGINMGPNMGTDVFYSGTVAVAREGLINGVPGVAFSLNSFSKKIDFEYAGDYARKIIEKCSSYLTGPSLLNVNFPDEPHYKGVKFTQLGFRVYQEKLVENHDPMGRPYYWIGGDFPTHHPLPGSDFEAVHSGYVSITPLTLDITDYKALTYWNNHQLDI